jgi:hypothetical protein
MKQQLRLPLFIFLPVCTLCSAQAQSLSDSLIAHFPLDGSPNDLIGSLAPTVTDGQPGFCADRFGNPNSAACFDGASFWSYGDVLDVDTHAFTLSAWIRVDSVPLPFEISPGFISEGSSIVGKGTTVFGTPTRAGYSLLAVQNSNNDYGLYGATGDGNNDVRLSQTQVDLDTWTHVALSRCGDHQLLYINGVLVADSLTPLERDLDVDIVFNLGAMNRDPTSYADSEWFIGALDDVRLYRGRCLTEEELDTLALGVGIDPITLISPGVEIYPVPATDVLCIRTSTAQSSPVKLTVTDAIGRVIIERTVNNTTMELDIAHLKPGVYCANLAGNHVQAYGKFIKE